MNILLLALILTVEPNGLTMQGALERIRSARAAGDSTRATVLVRGVNRITEPVRMTDADHDIDFVGEDGAALSGGVRVRGWTNAGGGVWEADVPRSADGRVRFFDQLWVNGRRATFARLPKKGGWMNISSASQVVASVVGTVTNYTDVATLDDASAKLLAKVPSEDYPYLEAGIVRSWCYGLRTLSAYDPKTDTVRFETKFPWKPWKQWSRTHTQIDFMNVRSAFTDPGECFLDMKAGKIRYRPLPGEDVPALEIVMPVPGQKQLLDLRGDWKNKKYVRDITFRGITFEYAGSGLDGNGPEQLDQYQAAFGSIGTIRLEGTRNVRFHRCTIAHTSGYGMRLHSACCETKVTRCRLTDVGAGGLRIGADFNSSDPREGITRIMLPANRLDSTAFNEISDCDISLGGRYNQEGVGVCIGHASDTKVIHNDIHDFYYTGVSVGFVWGFCGSVAQRNEIAYNCIWDIGKGVMSDLAGVYTLSTSYGTRVHHNIVHDVKCRVYGGWGLYADEGSEDIDFENNLVWNTTTGGFFQHFGTGCVVRNNILMFNEREGNVSTHKAKEFGTPCSLHVVNNIICTRTGLLSSEKTRNVPGVWANNVWWNYGGVTNAHFGTHDFATWKKLRRETGSVLADPHFADAEHGNFRLLPDSPALKLGFEPWNYSEAGIRPDMTTKLQAEIDAASVRGGGTVAVPKGHHIVGELRLKSNVTLHLPKGAVLEGAVGLEHYRNQLLPYSEGTWSAVVSGSGVTNIAITGEGEIFGNGKAWNPGNKDLDAMGCSEGLRPRGLFFGDCANIRLEGFKLRDAACWGIVFKRCADVVARKVRIDSCVNHNNDGFDIEARNVLIENCDINCGDDALCLKSNDPNFVVENVLVRDCAARTHCSAIKFGTASHGTMRKVRFERILIEAPRRVYRDLAPMPKDLLHPPRVKGAPGYLSGAGIGAICVECVDGGIVEDVTIDGVKLSGYKVPIFVRGGTRMHRGCGIPPNDKHILRNVLIQNVKGRAESRQVSSISGVPGCRPQNITLRNVDIACVGEGENKSPYREPGRELDGRYPEATMFGSYHLPVYGLYISQADDVKLENVHFTLRKGTTDARPAYLQK